VSAPEYPDPDPAGGAYDDSGTEQDTPGAGDAQP
jgi:hypothetical protein